MRMAVVRNCPKPDEGDQMMGSKVRAQDYRFGGKASRTGRVHSKAMYECCRSRALSCTVKLCWLAVLSPLLFGGAL